jgi:hypothetical protein
VKLGKRIVYEKKKEMQEKYVKMLLSWILGTIKRELNLYTSGGDTLDDLQDHTETALAYWRQNRQQYPPTWLYKSFESRYELRDWCKV